ncbi:hypothetical protein [Pontixanthobacter sp.]|uniref:hypothetical protein n=1 Tax=Pontixanthobacter sp. TaxID=2792078 RepID=UPI003C7DBFB8
MTSSETTYSQFMHLSAGLRVTKDDDSKVRFFPFSKNEAVEVPEFPLEKFGEILVGAGLHCIGNEERLWCDGYEDQVWIPALIRGVGDKIGEWPGHDWAALGHAHHKREESEQRRFSSAASFHLIGSARRLMHVSEWYHQMLLYVHLKNLADTVSFRNSDHTNFLIDCQSFLTEVGSARDYISGYAAFAIAGLTNISTFRGLWKNREGLPAKLRSIVEEAWQDSNEKLTLKHIGRYRDEIVHQRPITELSDGGFKITSHDIGLSKPLRGVKFDIQVWPHEKPDVKFDALRQFHAMMRVLYLFGRAVIALAPIEPEMPVINLAKQAGRIPPKTTRRVSYPRKMES